MKAVPDHELSVLVLAPFGRDAQLVCELLSDRQIDCERCEDIVDLCTRLRQGVGVVLVAGEALNPTTTAQLAATLAQQPSWSDIPLVIPTRRSQTRTARDWMVQALEPAGHITLLERPIRLASLLSVVRSALTTRRRQYETRDLLEELELSISRLDNEQLVQQRFINLLAHDLRGPLGVSKMSAQAMSEPHLQDRVPDLAERIIKSLDRADRMIRNLLDAHKLRAGERLPVQTRQCDLVAIAREAAGDLNASDRARLVLSSPDKLTGHWDADLLLRALWNLLTNAVKYGATDMPIEIDIARQAQQATVAVRNWGMEIPAEEQGLLFEPYKQGGKQTRDNSGWGLGLSLVQGVAATHGGNAELSSEAGAGTTFTLHLPLDARPFQPSADVGSDGGRG